MSSSISWVARTELVKIIGTVTPKASLFKAPPRIVPASAQPTNVVANIRR